MIYIPTLTTLIIILAISFTNSEEIPTIDIYIESLSPESNNFILNSFLQFHSNPDHDKLANVNFLPYGQSTEFWKNSELYFNCTRGDNECFGNLVLICGINYMTVEYAHNFIICIESHIEDYKNDFVLTLQKCIRDEAKGTHILSCAQGRVGKRYMHDVGVRTKKHDYLPWVLYNGQHDVEIEKKVIENMLDFLCRKQENTEITGCVNRQR